MAMLHRPVLQPFPALKASKPLPNFLKGVPELPIDDQREIVEQALVIFERYYVNLPLKEALHAAEPIRQLKLLKNQLRPAARRRKQGKESPKDDTRSRSLGFHYQLHAIFNSVRDLHTSYSLAKLYDPNDKTSGSPRAFLGFEIETCYRKNSQRRRYLVSHVTRELHKAGTCFQPGVEVLFWNGVPIERAVAVNAERQAGGNAAARRARGLTLMTMRPLEISLPPDEDWVIVTYRYKVKRRWVIENIKLDWQVIHYEPEPTQGRFRFTMGVDHQGDAVRQMRQRHFAPDADGSASSGDGPAGSSPPGTSGLAGAAPASTKASGHGILTEEITKQVPPHLQHPKLMRAWIIDGAAVGQPGKKFGYIRIYSFKVATRNVNFQINAGAGDAGQQSAGVTAAADHAGDPVDAFVQTFEEYLKRLPAEGLLIDVRDNPGGDITAGERLLELLTPQRIEPERFQFICSLETLKLCRHNSAPQLPNDVDWTEWVESLDQALATGTDYSRGFPITRVGLNQRGQTYHGPVALITSALSYSTTDIFAAGFEDHRIGRVLGVDPNTGAGGANVMTQEDLRKISPDSADLKQLSKGVAIRAALRRALRVKNQSGTLLEDLGVSILPENRYRMTEDDLLCHNKDLLTWAVKILVTKGTPRKLVKVASPRATRRASSGFEFDVEVLNVSHLAIYIDDLPFDTLTQKMAGKFQVRIPRERARGGSVVRLEAFDGKDLVASRRIELPPTSPTNSPAPSP